MRISKKIVIPVVAVVSLSILTAAGWMYGRPYYLQQFVASSASDQAKLFMENLFDGKSTVAYNQVTASVKSRNTNDQFVTNTARYKSNTAVLTDSSTIANSLSSADYQANVGGISAQEFGVRIHLVKVHGKWQVDSLTVL